MKILLGSRILYIIGASILILVALFSLFKVTKNNNLVHITGTVTYGDVTQIVSVSGVIDAKNVANLAFPVIGTVGSIEVKEGDFVERGQALMTLKQDNLLADRNSYLASLSIADANRDELLNGPRDEARGITQTTVEIASENLARTTLEESEKVTNAKRLLLSSNLEASPIQKDNEDIPPTVTGAYICDETGTYFLKVFNSAANSGYSYYLTGLEKETSTAYTKSPGALGQCGLAVQFSAGERYGNSDWAITIPNTHSSTYVANLNAYNLALQQQTTKVSSASKALDLALEQQILSNASPRDEELRRANAEVLQAQSRLAHINSQISDRTLRAPFDGTITRIDILPGETTGTQPIITVISEDKFEITARIPEIDITKISIGQQAEVLFDARQSEVVLAHITFISPLAIEIDGVAYFEAHLGFENIPDWIRSGMSADIDIITEKKEGVLRVPKRFLIKNEKGFSLMISESNKKTLTEIKAEIGFVGNDGFVEILNLSEGDVLVAP